jgi:thiazole synthase ThiGH ThiG subunit
MKEENTETTVDLHVDASPLKRILPDYIQSALSERSHIRVIAREVKRGYWVKKETLFSRLSELLPGYKESIEKLKQCAKRNGYNIFSYKECDFVLSEV